MKRTVVAIALLFAFATFGVNASAQPTATPNKAGPTAPQAGPKIELLDPVYNFGTVLSGKAVTHTFKFRNVGKANLIIGTPSTSCGCTAAKPTRKNLAPGQEGAVTVNFDTRFEKGHQVRTVTIPTNDPAHRQAVMSLEGDIRQQVAVTPSTLDFGKIKHKSEVTKEVRITDATGRKGFKVGAVTHADKAIKVVKEPRKDGKPGAVLKVTVPGTMPVGQFDDIIKVATNRVPVQIGVFGTVEGELNVSPAQVSFGIVQPGQGATRFMRLTNNGSRPLRILGISSSNATVSASAQPIKPGRQFKIAVQLSKSAHQGQVRGELTIKTDDPTQGSLKVPFYGIIGQFKT